MSQILKHVLADIGAESKRMATQGASELAAALFNGHAFVPYGPGQNRTPPSAQEHDQTVSQTEIERGREM